MDSWPKDLSLEGVSTRRSSCNSARRSAAGRPETHGPSEHHSGCKSPRSFASASCYPRAGQLCRTPAAPKSSASKRQRVPSRRCASEELQQQEITQQKAEQCRRRELNSQRRKIQSQLASQIHVHDDASSSDNNQTVQGSCALKHSLTGSYK